MRDIFSSDATRAVLADWVELELAFTSRMFVTDSLVVRSDEPIAEDFDEVGSQWDEGAYEMLDKEILDDRDEIRRTDVWDELTLRQDILGDLYPFKLSQLGATSWKLERRSGPSEEVAAAHRVYESALIMSAFRHGHIRKQAEEDKKWKALEAKIAELFQDLSVFAAAMLLGEAYSFGWPRPDKSAFRKAAEDAVKAMGLGKVREDFPLDSSGKEKDGTLDVIAWRTFRDRTYGALLMFGQVASGSNWNSKPIFSYLEQKFLRYLDPTPSRHYIGAIFMPFLMHTELTVQKTTTVNNARADHAHGLEMTYGTVVDRLRLTELLGRGLPGEEQLHNGREPELVLQDAAKWADECRSYCEASS